MQTQTKPDITLSTGRVVRHTPMDNGAQSADMADGGDMSQAEWEDYCALLAKRNAMTAQELQRIVCKLANGAWCRYWLDYDFPALPKMMAVQCVHSDGIPLKIQDAERHGLKESAKGFIYTVCRTNEDGTPYESAIDS